MLRTLSGLPSNMAMRSWSMPERSANCSSESPFLSLIPCNPISNASMPFPPFKLSLGFFSCPPLAHQREVSFPIVCFEFELEFHASHRITERPQRTILHDFALFKLGWLQNRMKNRYGKMHIANKGTFRHADKTVALQHLSPCAWEVDLREWTETCKLILRCRSASGSGWSGSVRWVSGGGLRTQERICTTSL